MNTTIPRLITDHKLNGLNDAITVKVLDEPGPGGANHRYHVAVQNDGATAAESFLYFQNGPIGEAGINGNSNEAYLAVVIDRLRGFQYLRHLDGSFDLTSRGKYACRENAVALTHLEDALMWLQKRTRDRLARGVEGKNAP